MKRNPNFRANTHLFNLRLYLEGLRRLRVVGLVVAILSMTQSALIPLVYWLANGKYRLHPREIEPNALAVPTALVIFLSPLFAYVLFSFLHKRRESDFFHSIPYTRTCVYVSFVLAALSVIAAIQVACSAISCILWWICPVVTTNVWAIWPFTAVCFLSAALLSSIMTLVLTVSGTGGMTFLLFGTLTALPRVAGLIFASMLCSITEMADFDAYMTNSILGLQFQMPLSVLWHMVSEQECILYTPRLILYTIFTTVALFALGGFLYNRRHSEWAGNHAPGPRTQTLFRLIFTLPIALCIPCILVMDPGDGGTLLLIVTAVTLLCWFLYELITTKRARAMLASFKSLWILAVILVAFTGAVYLGRTVIHHEYIRADEIRSVTMSYPPVTGIGIIRTEYYTIRATEKPASDQAIREIVADGLAATQKNDSGAYYNVAIRMKDGRTLYRVINLSVPQCQRLCEAYDALSENNAEQYDLPPLNTLRSVVGMKNGSDWSVDYEEVKDIYKILCKEYQTLSPEQKRHVLAPLGGDSSKYNGISIWYSGRTVTRDYLGFENEKPFSGTVYLTEDLPRTRAYILQNYVVSTSTKTYLILPDYGKRFVYPHEVFKALQSEDTYREYWNDENQYHVDLSVNSDLNTSYMEKMSASLPGSQLLRVIELFAAREPRVACDDPPPVTDQTCIVKLSFSRFKQTFRGDFYFVVDLSKEDLTTLREIVSDD